MLSVADNPYALKEFDKAEDFDVNRWPAKWLSVDCGNFVW